MPAEVSVLSRVRQFVPFNELVRPRPALIDRGFGLIYDTARDITWLQDANYAKTIGRSRDGQLTWPQAIAWVGSLNYRGIRGWRLPDARNEDGSGPALGENCAGSELGHLLLEVLRQHPNLVEFKNSTLPCIYWTGTEANTDEAYALQVYVIRQGTLPKDPFSGEIRVPLIGPVLSWPVHDGDVGAGLAASFLRRIVSWTRSLFGG